MFKEAFYGCGGDSHQLPEPLENTGLYYGQKSGVRCHWTTGMGTKASFPNTQPVGFSQRRANPDPYTRVFDQPISDRLGRFQLIFPGEWNFSSSSPGRHNLVGKQDPRDARKEKKQPVSISPWGIAFA